MKWKLVLLGTVMLMAINPLMANSNIVVQNGVLVDRIDGSLSAMPAQWRNLAEGTTYIDPTGAEVTSFQSIFSDLYQSNFEAAATAALLLEYRLVAFTDDDDLITYYILERDPSSTSTNFWGTYVFNPSPDRGQLVIQSSHPRFDTFTGKQGIYVFQQMGAAFYYASGTHRCNSPTPSGCAGTSSVCSNSIGGVAAPQEFSDEGSVFREGDVAHNDSSMFQRVTEWLHDQNPGYYFFIQLHGFSQNLTPHVILSNGRDENYTPPQDDKLSTLRTQLILQWDLLANHQESLDIEVAHDDPDDNFNSLLGTTNTQGRYINGSNNPCGQSAPQNTGNFIHIEMGRKGNDYYLRTENQWPVLVQALMNTFVSAPLPVELLSFEGELRQNEVTLSWETAWEEGNSHFVVQRSAISVNDFEDVGLVAGNGTSDRQLHYQWTDRDLPSHSNGSVFYRLKQVDFNGNYEYSEIVSIRLPRQERKYRLLQNNRGSGRKLTVKIPCNMLDEDKVQVWLTHLHTGQYIEQTLPVSEVETRLRHWLSKRPPGLYQIMLMANGQVVKGKYLRL